MDAKFTVTSYLDEPLDNTIKNPTRKIWGFFGSEMKIGKGENIIQKRK